MGLAVSLHGLLFNTHTVHCKLTVVGLQHNISSNLTGTPLYCKLTVVGLQNRRETVPRLKFQGSTLAWTGVAAYLQSLKIKHMLLPRWV